MGNTEQTLRCGRRRAALGTGRPARTVLAPQPHPSRAPAAPPAPAPVSPAHGLLVRWPQTLARPASLDIPYSVNPSPLVQRLLGPAAP